MRGHGSTITVRNITRGPVAWREDPWVSVHGFSSYIGHPVVLEGAGVGLLSCYFIHERLFTPEEEHVMGILARALAIEEERY